MLNLSTVASRAKSMLLKPNMMRSLDYQVLRNTEHVNASRRLKLASQSVSASSLINDRVGLCSKPISAGNYYFLDNCGYEKVKNFIVYTRE